MRSVGLRHVFYVEIGSTLFTFGPLLCMPDRLATFFYGPGPHDFAVVHAATMYALVAIAWSLLLLGGLRSSDPRTRAWVLGASMLGDALMITASAVAIHHGVVTIGTVSHLVATAIYFVLRALALWRPSLL